MLRNLLERGVWVCEALEVSPQRGMGLRPHFTFLAPAVAVLVKESRQRASIGKGHVHDAPLNTLVHDLHVGRFLDRLGGPELLLKNLATVIDVLAAFHAIRLVRIGRLLQRDGPLLHVLKGDLHEAVVYDGKEGEQSDVHGFMHDGLELFDPRHVSVEKDAVHDGAVVFQQNGGEMVEEVLGVSVKVVGRVGDAEIAREDPRLGGFADA